MINLHTFTIDVRNLDLKTDHGKQILVNYQDWTRVLEIMKKNPSFIDLVA